MQKVNREELLNQLEMVQPGLSPKDVVEQSSCVVFEDGRVFTFNDEVFCSMDCCLDVTGAVPAKPLLAILHKMPEETLSIEVADETLVIKGKRRRAKLRMEAEITLPKDSVEMPKEDRWKELPEDFCTAVETVRECAGSDETHFSLTCVHVHPEWVEACDNFQVTRFNIETGLKKPVLVRSKSLMYVSTLSVAEWASTKAWLHFRTSKGLVISCRKYREDYPDLQRILDVSGSPASLPKGLAEAASLAEVFSAEDADNNEVEVSLLPGKVKIKGEGAAGSYIETKKMSYKGPSLKFTISPKLLVTITKRHHECEVTSGALKVDGGRFVYVTSLGQVGDGETEGDE